MERNTQVSKGIISGTTVVIEPGVDLTTLPGKISATCNKEEQARKR